MKKINKILPIFMLILLVFAFVSPVFAAKGNVDPGFNFSGTGGDTLKGKLGNVWNVISMVANFIAVVMVVFSGIRYMFASADAKADIKKQTVILIIGAVLIFAAGNIVNLIANTATEVIN